MLRFRISRTNYLYVRNIVEYKNLIKRYLVLVLSLAALNQVPAQTSPIFLPDDFIFEAEDVGCVCNPGVINKSPGKGVLIEYQLTSGGNFTPDEIAAGISPSKVNNLGRLRLRLKVPVVVKPKTKFLLGFDHFQEVYNFNFIQPVFAQQLDLVEKSSLKATRFSAYLIQSVNETNYVGLRARVAYSGNYGGFVNTDSYFRQMRISGIWGVKKRDDLEWGIGLIYSQNFTRKIALPFFLYNRTYNERWGIEAAFPVSVLMRYNFNPRSLILFGPEFSSAAYALRGESGLADDDYYFRHSALQFGAKYERQLLPWIWANVHTGLQINFDAQYTAVLDDNDLFEPDLITGVFLKVGLFLSPPD